MCWYCQEWERHSPKSLARWLAIAHGSRDPRGCGLLLAANEMAEEIIATTKTKVLRRMIANWRACFGPVIYVEGLQASDGSRITAEGQRAL